MIITEKIYFSCSLDKRFNLITFRWQTEEDRIVTTNLLTTTYGEEMGCIVLNKIGDSATGMCVIFEIL